MYIHRDVFIQEGLETREKRNLSLRLSEGRTVSLILQIILKPKDLEYSVWKRAVVITPMDNTP